MGRRRAAMRLFSVDELDTDTCALLYDVLHPPQRKAVIRELLRAYDSKFDTKSQLPFVRTTTSGLTQLVQS